MTLNTNSHVPRLNLAGAAEKFFDSGKAHWAVDALIDGDNAVHILNNFNYTHQRPATENHAKSIALLMSSGTFRPCTVLEFAILNGVPIVLDGQHRLWGVALSEQPTMFHIKMTRVSSMAEVEALYSTFDIGRKRTTRDTLGTIGDDLDMTTSDLSVLSGAVSVINVGGLSIGQRTAARIVVESRDNEFNKSLMRFYAPPARQFLKALTGTPGAKLFRRVNVMAVAIVTFQHQPDIAGTFWRAASLDDGLRRNDPRKALLTWLKENSGQREQQHRAAIACWNAHFASRPMTRVRIAPEMTLKIAGTPADFAIAQLRPTMDDESAPNVTNFLADRLQDHVTGAIYRAPDKATGDDAGDEPGSQAEQAATPDEPGFANPATSTSQPPRSSLSL